MRISPFLKFYFINHVDPDQLDSDEARRSGSTVFHLNNGMLIKLHCCIELKSQFHKAVL